MNRKATLNDWSFWERGIRLYYLIIDDVVIFFCIKIPTKPPSLMKKTEQCVVLYDYDANSPGDITIK